MSSKTNARAYEAKLEALHAHANILSNVNSIDDIADYTLDTMENTLGFTWASFNYVEDNFITTSITSRSGSRTRIDTMRHIDSPGIGTRAARTGETQLANDTRKDIDYVGVFMNENTFTKLDENTQKTILQNRELGGAGWNSLSEIEVPAKIDQKVVAILGVESLDLNAFTEQDQKLLETLASHVASAIQRIRLLEERIQYEAKLEALHAHANILSNVTSIDKIADYTLDTMENTLGFTWASFNYVEDNFITTVITSRSGSRTRDDSMKHIEWPGISNRAIRTGETQLVNDTRLDIDYVGVFMNENTFSKLDKNIQKVILHNRELGGAGWDSLSEIEVPVKIDQKVVAILGAESLDLNAFTEQDQKLLETLASHVASAIQRIRLLEEHIQHEVKLKTLHVHASKLADATSIEEVEEHTLEAIRNTLDNFAWVSILYVKDNYIIGESWKMPIQGPGISTRAARTGETQLIADTRKDVDYIGVHMGESTKSSLEDPLRKIIMREKRLALSEIEVPVKVGQSVVAVLGGESLELNSFNEQDQELLETLASHVASSIQRIRFQEERERVQQELVLERVRVEQANELDRMKNQFISTATHELRTPVTSIIGFLELVLDYSSEELPDTVRQDLNIVFRNAMRLVDMTNDLLDVQRITSGRFEITLEEVELINTLNEVIEELTPLFDDKQQTLIVNAPNELKVAVDETRISQLFINVLRNANKFTPEEGTIEITVEPSESYVQISIKDSGIGLSEEDIGKLFKPFPFIQHEVEVSSTGLGLAISKGIVDMHNGEIWAESEGKGMGSTFFIKIPLKE